MINEKLTTSTSIEDIIHDFVHSKDPRFDGKSKAQRIMMAKGAYYDMHPELSRATRSKNVMESLMLEWELSKKISDITDRIAHRFPGIEKGNLYKRIHAHMVQQGRKTPPTEKVQAESSIYRELSMRLEAVTADAAIPYAVKSPVKDKAPTPVDAKPKSFGKYKNLQGV